MNEDNEYVPINKKKRIFNFNVVSLHVRHFGVRHKWMLEITLVRNNYVFPLYFRVATNIVIEYRSVPPSNAHNLSPLTRRSLSIF